MAKHAVKIVYRSKKISFPLMAAIQAADGWEKGGIDLQRLDFVGGAAKSDPMLINGEVDFIFGSHISPYIHKANGVPIVYLGQSVNWTNDSLVTRDAISDVAQLRGKVFAEGKVKVSNHPWGNHKLYLRRGGIDLSEIEFIGADSEGKKGTKPYEMVAEGLADAAFVSRPADLAAEALGLTVTQLPFLPMVQSTTITTMWNTRQNRADACRGVITAVREGIKFFKYQPEAMFKVLETEVADKLGITDERELRHLYEINVQLLDERLYPTTEAIANAFRIATLEDPSIIGKINPMELWDIDLLRQLDAG